MMPAAFEAYVCMIISQRMQNTNRILKKKTQTQSLFIIIILEY